MDRSGFALAFALIGSIYATLHSGASTATAQRTFVASNGNDSGPCSVAQPCRSFAVAIANTNVQGEVVVLDSAGYGAVMITKAVSIIAPTGIYAGISVFTGEDGVDINAAPTDRIVLRGLTINGQGGLAGISISNAGEVDIESCVISNLFVGVESFAPGAHVRIAGSTLSSNTGLAGAQIKKGTLTVDNSEIVRNKDGMWLLEGESATIRGSRFNDNTGNGILVAPVDSSASTMVVSESDFSGNGTDGIKVDLITIPSGQISLGLALDKASLSHNAFYGLEVLGQAATFSNVSVSDSQVAFNGLDGIRVNSNSVALVSVTQSTINDNGSVGVAASGGSSVIVALDRNMIARNGDNDIAQAASAVVRTFGNNALTGNGAGDVSGSLVPVTTK